MNNKFAGLYADTAYDWITALCKTDNVACVKGENNDK